MSRALMMSVLLVNIFHSSTFAQNMLKRNDVVKQRSCYSGIFEEYDTWVEMINTGHQRNAKTPEQLEIRLNNFE